MGATELRGPVNYNYKDLKSATKNFIEENKLGEGGFGDVYKVNVKEKAQIFCDRFAFLHRLGTIKDRNGKCDTI